MGIFDVFRRKTKAGSQASKPRMKFDSQGEWITYTLHDKEIGVETTWMKGVTLYTESLGKWKGGSPLTDEEREKVFTDVVNFLKRKRERPIVVINMDDPLKDSWEQLCALNQPAIKRVEYTSDEEEYQFERSLWLRSIEAGKGLILNGIEITTEEELDQAMQKGRKHRAG